AEEGRILGGLEGGGDGRVVRGSHQRLRGAAARERVRADEESVAAEEAGLVQAPLSSNSSSSPSSSSQWRPTSRKPKRRTSASEGALSGSIEAMMRSTPCSRVQPM